MSNSFRRIAAGLVLASCFILSANAQSMYRSEEKQQQSPKVPKKIEFAGDVITFERSDLYERMDRELMAFTYSHTISMLMLKRSERIFEQITPILNLYGIPDDLKYLMVIESNLDPKARSGAGAAGLWQFMEGTATEYGLVVNGEVDERYNIEKETKAACQYLTKSYEKYKDWLTVAASYNAGQAGISRRLDDQNQTKATDLWMPEETSRYIFRVLAAKMMFQNPEAFGFFVDKTDKYPYIPPKQTVTVSGSIEDLVDFAAQYGVSYRALKEANLWLRDNKLVNKSKHTYQIIIPDER